MRVSEKIHRILYIVLAAFLAIVLRVWHLGVVQREEKLLAAEKPRQRSILLRADRGPIYDRFHIPLAVNKILYNATVYYEPIAQIPSVSWRDDGNGRRFRVFARSEYIRKLASILAKTLDLDAERIEDLIHSKASLFPHAPFLLKGEITEKEYYRLKALEKDWPGVCAEIASSRTYPLGKTASHLIGAMGAISASEYEALAQEMKQLQEAISLEILPQGYSSFEAVYERLFELKEKAYALNDVVGKMGCEAKWEEWLRGFFGKKILEVDQKGRFVRELPGKNLPIAGREITLSLSSELQQFAEKLLQGDEKRRFALHPKKPWVRGGAIVALDPNTGEVLAMASYPCFDPNDFVPSANPTKNREKQKKIRRFLENDPLIAALWEGREEEEGILLSWDGYLDRILSKESSLRTFFQKVDTVQSAIQVQEDFEALRYFSPGKTPLSLLETLKGPSPLLQIEDPRDRLFAIDLCRLIVDASRFSDALLEKIGNMKLSEYYSLHQAFQRLQQEVRTSFQEQFHKGPFQQWKTLHQKEFLAQKRREEKEKKTYAKPYLDYLDQKEKELFQDAWREARLSILTEHAMQEAIFPRECLSDFLHTFRSFEQLDRPLLGHYQRLRNRQKEQTEKDLAAAFYPIGGHSFLRSYAFQSGAPLGSIFKLVTAYEGLKQGIPSFLLIDELGIDSQKKHIVAYTPNRAPYPRIYKGGRLPRSSSSRIGKIDLIGAIAQSSNPYFSLLAGDYFKDPNDLAQAAYAFGFGEKSGIDLPAEGKGHLPCDLKTNRTGLYSFAIGQHTFLCTPLQSAVMLAAIANGGKILKPKLFLSAKGSHRLRDPMQAFSSDHPLAKRELEAIGIHFPLFTKGQSSSPFSQSKPSEPEIRRLLPLTSAMRNQLLEGMDRAIWGERGNARPSIIRSLAAHPEIAADFLSLKHQIVGKTSTAEFLYNPGIEPSSQPKMRKHTGFGAISFENGCWDKPELIVVVFLRHGDSGKEAAPLAAQMVCKWRSIKKAQRNNIAAAPILRPKIDL